MRTVLRVAFSGMATAAAWAAAGAAVGLLVAVAAAWVLSGE